MVFGREWLLDGGARADLRRSTVLTYERLLHRLGALDEDLTKERALARLYSIDNPNTVVPLS